MDLAAVNQDSRRSRTLNENSPPCCRRLTQTGRDEIAEIDEHTRLPDSLPERRLRRKYRGQCAVVVHVDRHGALNGHMRDGRLVRGNGRAAGSGGEPRQGSGQVHQSSVKQNVVARFDMDAILFQERVDGRALRPPLERVAINLKRDGLGEANRDSSVSGDGLTARGHGQVVLVQADTCLGQGAAHRGLARPQRQGLAVNLDRDQAQGSRQVPGHGTKQDDEKEK